MGLKQHVVEFTASGVTTDGTLAAGAGPFSWVVPQGVCELGMNATGAGGGGSSGYGAGVSRSGGAAGCTGLMMHGALLPVIPSTSLTITLGAGGSGGAVGGGATAGGATTIAGLNQIMGSRDGIAGTIQISGGSGGGGTGSSYAGSSGGMYYDGGGSNAALGSSGDTGDSIGRLRIPGIFGGLMAAFQGGGGGGANSSGATAGANGGAQARNAGGNFVNVLMGTNGASPATGGAGSTDGTISYGGGGCGPSSFYGSAGAPGAGNTAAAAGVGYGYGGSGGGGNAVGSAGGGAYVRFVYWSTD